MVPLLACCIELFTAYIAVVDGICWTAPLFLFHLWLDMLLSLSFLSVKFSLFSHIRSKFSLQLFLMGMIYFLMSSLSKASCECFVALPAYKAIDGTPLLLNRFTSRLPESLLLYLRFFLSTIDGNKLKWKTYFFFFNDLEIDFVLKVKLSIFNFDSLIFFSEIGFLFDIVHRDTFPMLT